MNLIVMERLRPLVGSKGWDYCVLWKLSEDQRSLEWMICCCGGAEMSEDKDDENGGKELMFPVSAVVACRDVMFQHPRTKSCDLLAHQPSSIPLDSGYHLIHAQAFISNQPKWLKFSNSSLDLDSSNHLGEPLSETVGTRVLVPVPGGLVELFVAKQVSEDQHVIDFITAQLNMSMEQEALTNQSNMEFSVTNADDGMNNDLNQRSYLGNIENGQKVDLDLDHDHDHHENNHQFHPRISPASATLDILNLPYDISADRIRLSGSSPMNFLHQFHSSSADTRTKSDVFFDASDKPMDPFNYSSENGLQEMDMMNNSPNMHIHFMEPGMVNKDDQGNNNDKDSAKRKIGMSDSVSDCSDQIDDEDIPKFQRRAGKGPQSKNLMAERKRRKKLNDRLYHLRALVPKISKLDRASILGDAIEFVKELQKQAKELQDELEDNSDDEGPKNTGNNSVLQSEIQNRMGCKPEQDHKVQNMGVFGSDHREPEISNEKTQQMEPQVEVCQIDGNEFFLKVFCEYKAGGFVRLMEALSSLGLVVTNANVTRFRGLVSNVFRVEMRDCEMIQADHVRDSLLELTRDPYRDMGKGAMEDEMCNLDFHQHQQQQQQQDLYSHSHSNGHHLHHLHHLHN